MICGEDSRFIDSDSVRHARSSERMEVMAVLKALQYTQSPDVLIHCDCQPVVKKINAISASLHAYGHDGLKSCCSDYDLWRQIAKHMQGRSVIAEWIKSKTPNTNLKVDTLAHAEAKRVL